MKVEVFSHSFPTDAFPFNGTFVRDHAKAIEEFADVLFTLLSPAALPFSKRARANKSVIHHPKGRRLSYLSYPKKRRALFTTGNIIRAFKKLTFSDADIFHLQFLYPAGLLTPAIKRMGKAVVITVHGDDFHSSIKEKELRELVHNAMNQADAVIAVGNLLRNDIIAEFPDLESKIIVIHNYFRSDSFPLKTDNTEREARTHLNWTEDQTHVLTVANVVPKKGIDVLIEAIETAFKQPDIQFHIVGRLNNNKDYVLKIQSMVHDYELENVFLYGAVSQDELKHFYQAADFFVLPSRNEPFGISLLEAAASGLPVLSTHSGGPSEIINEDIGLIIEPDNVETLATNIKTLQNSYKSYDKVAMRKYVEDTFGMEKYREAYRELYDQLFNS